MEVNWCRGCVTFVPGSFCDRVLCQGFALRRRNHRKRDINDIPFRRESLRQRSHCIPFHVLMLMCRKTRLLHIELIGRIRVKTAHLERWKRIPMNYQRTIGYTWSYSSIWIITGKHVCEVSNCGETFMACMMISARNWGLFKKQVKVFVILPHCENYSTYHPHLRGADVRLFSWWGII